MPLDYNSLKNDSKRKEKSKRGGFGVKIALNRHGLVELGRGEIW